MSLRLLLNTAWLPVTVLGMMFISSLVNAQDISNTGTSNIYGTSYKSIGQCGDYPRVSAETPNWACVGIVAGPDHDLKMPREVLPLQDGSILVTDMIGWLQEGKIWRISRDANERIKADAIFEGLKHPSGLRMGPDGMVYVGEEHRIWHFDPNDPTRAKTVIIDGLPKKEDVEGPIGHYHPISHFIFDAAGNIIINLGSIDDRCERVVNGQGFPNPCPSDEASNMESGLWKVTFDQTSGQWGAPQRFARGLRNSIALAVHPESGLLLQAENNIDLWEGTILSPTNPPEEFNVVRDGKHYGWPYCVGNNRVVPDYSGRVSCNTPQFEPPISLLPAHSSPFGMEYYRGALFPELNGKLILALHSKHPNGHRIAMFDVDGDGKPVKLAGQNIAQFLLENWTENPGRRPSGRPGGLMVDTQGAIWFTDYDNDTLMVILRSGGDGSDAGDDGNGGEGNDDSPPYPGAALRKGSSGTNVETLQRLLVQAGHEIAVDGDFGNRTRAAVRAFQTAEAIQIDGIVGRQTWARLTD